MATSQISYGSPSFVPTNLSFDGASTGSNKMFDPGANLNSGAQIGGTTSPTGNSNQYFPVMPGITANNQPGVVPPSSTPTGSSPSTRNNYGLTNWGNGFMSENPLFPNLTNQLGDFLKGQLGKGATPFDLSALLPSSGGATGAGQMSAPLTQLLQSLQGMMSGQVDPSSMGAMGGAFGTLANVAKNGINAVPTWQTMVDAMQRQIGQGAGNLREQFASMGNLAGSPFGQAMVDYQTQSNKDLNSQLAQMQFQGIQQQLQAAQGIMDESDQLGQFIQGLDQSSVDRLYNEFLRTQPEYNPLLGSIMGLGTTFQPVLTKNYGIGAGAALQGVGSILSGLGDITKKNPGQ